MAEKVKKASTAAAPRKTTTVKAATGAAAAKKATPRAKTVKVKTVSHEKIAELAHCYFAERGHKHGHHEEDWLRAERELLGKAS